MEKSKIVMSLWLVVLMILGTLSVSLADTPENEMPFEENKVVINEYELLKELSSKSESTLSEKGYSSKEIQKLKNFHQIYVDHLNELKKLDDSTLKKLGYTPKQIIVLRDFDESEEQAISLAADLRIYSSTANFNYDGNYSRGRLVYNWYWTGVPSFKLQDAVAVSWNNWAVESNTSYVSYYTVNTGDFYTNKNATFTTEGHTYEGAGHKFNVSMSDHYYYAQRGGGTFDVRSDSHIEKDFAYYIAYGHQMILPSITFSLTPGGGAASLSFNNGTVIQDANTGEYKF